jgi:hypothetical protein
MVSPPALVLDVRGTEDFGRCIVERQNEAKQIYTENCGQVNERDIKGGHFT